MMKIASSRGRQVIGADALNIPMQDACADCVTAFSALHHIFDYEQTVREMARMLKPGGVFYTDWDPNGHVTHEGWAVKSAVWLVKKIRSLVSTSTIEESREQALAEFHHFSEQGFQADNVVKALEESGVGEIEVCYHVNPPTLRRDQGYGIKGIMIASLKLLSGSWPGRKNVMPWIAITGIKK
jgi:SAM-dependent methyltransferase